jgi:hypothetical protein
MKASSRGEDICFLYGTIHVIVDFCSRNVLSRGVNASSLGGSYAFLLLIQISGVVSKESTIVALYRMWMMVMVQAPMTGVSEKKKKKKLRTEVFAMVHVPYPFSRHP